MSEYREEEAPRARVHLAKWSPWVWIVPAVALFFAVFLVVRYGFFGGGDITVKFADARGLDRYSPVRFRGAKVGTVQKITIDEDLGQVVVRISMDASMNHALNKGTRFWIVEPGLEGGGLGGILSGTYVAIAPGTGDQTRDFTGQEYAPVLTPAEKGKTVILEAHGLGSLAVGSPVQYNGLRVGSVLGSDYDLARGVTQIHVFITQRFADRVRQGTRFWRGGGLQISLSGGGVSMAGASLGSLLNSPVSFFTPEVFSGAEVPSNTHFDLYDSEAAAMAWADGAQLVYVIYFNGPVRGLAAGTPVFMKGVEVGHVRDVRLRYVPETASLETPVTFEIDPRLLQLPLAVTREELRSEMNDALAKLVRKGMRATLSTSLVLPGASGISLENVASAGSARLVVENDPPIVPSATSGTGIDQALGSINRLAARVENLPIEEIAGHLRSTSARMDQLVHDPALDESLHRLDAALGDVQKVAATTRENIGPIVSSLRNTAAAAEQAASRAQQLMASAPRQNYDLGNMVMELTKAAESVRALASYLEENPDALLKGRGKAK
jgi:paraquat-inducible protein B